MQEDRFVQPRQIYASTLARRDRRWTGRRGRVGFGAALVTVLAVAAAVTVVAAVAQNVT